MPFGLGCRFLANDWLVSNGAPAAIESDANLVAVSRRSSARARYPDPVGADLFQPDIAEIAAHVGDDVVGRIGDFIKQLFGHRSD